ncbi:MAG: carboxypeptidase regulatory-like domain-containing protein [Planctomycetes bacterium]|nr:carboxypeptidase regulatory-like domain-containing protein [Planctomycetota bacterium]
MLVLSAAAVLAAVYLVCFKSRNPETGELAMSAAESEPTARDFAAPVESVIASPAAESRLAGANLASAVRENGEPKPEPRAGRTVDGFVMNDNGERVADARVFLVTGLKGKKRIRETVSDGSGEFHFENVKSTKGWLEAMREDGAMSDSPVRLSETPDEHGVRLSVPGPDPHLDLSIIQVLYPNASPASDSFIFNIPPAQDVGFGFASKAGFFQSEDQQTGTVLAADPDLKYLTVARERPTLTSKNLIIQFVEPAPEVDFEITGRGGTIIKEFEYEYVEPIHLSFRDAESDDDEGARTTVFRHSGNPVPIPFDRCVLGIAVDGYNYKRVGPLDPRHIPATINIQLTPIVSKVVRIIAKDKAILNASADFAFNESTPYPWDSKADCTKQSDGTFLLSAQHEGSFYLTIHADGFARREATITFDPTRAEPTVDVELERATSIDFAVIDDRGTPVQGVLTTRQGAQNRMDTLSSDGHVVFNDLQRGEYRVSVQVLQPLSSNTSITFSMEEPVTALVGVKNNVTIECPATFRVPAKLYINNDEGRPGFVHCVSQGKTGRGANHYSAVSDAPADSLVVLSKGVYDCSISIYGNGDEVDLTFEKPAVSIDESIGGLRFDLTSGAATGRVSGEENRNAMIRRQVRFEWKGPSGEKCSGFANTWKGNFIFPNVPAGECTFSIGESGKSRTVRIEQGKTAIVNFD